MIDYDALLNRDFPAIEQSYTEADCALYALGIGLGSDPVDPGQLNGVFERAPGFAPLPSMVTVLGYDALWPMKPGTGLTWEMILHGEQSLTLFAPLPRAGAVRGKMRITEIVDKGAERGAVIYTENRLTDVATGAEIARTTATIMARGDGGFGGPSGTPKPVHRVPERAPDHVHDFKTSTQASLIYRLCGDLNPLHADPAVAAQAGFDRPILHGLCTLGVAGWGVPSTLRAGDFSALTHLQLRFTAPVFPGETLRTEIWEDAGAISFRTTATERDVVVLNNGLARLHA